MSHSDMILRRAPKDAASFGISGSTVHSLPKLPIKKSIAQLGPGLARALQSRLQRTGYLIIDEKLVVYCTYEGSGGGKESKCEWHAFHDGGNTFTFHRLRGQLILPRAHSSVACRARRRSGTFEDYSSLKIEQC